MPDLISHVLLGLILAYIFNIKPRSIVVLGAILPDTLGKLKMINYLIPGAPEWITPFSNLFHNPLPLFIFVLIVALFFIIPYIKSILFISLGASSHLLADGTTKSFLFKGYLPILWADQYYYALLVLIVLYIIIIKYNLKIFGREEYG